MESKCSDCKWFSRYPVFGPSCKKGHFNYMIGPWNIEQCRHYAKEQIKSAPPAGD